jgi:hypothetical protein
MVETSVQPTPSATSCCATPDVPTASACVLCRRAVCRNCRRFVNQKQVCVDCLKKIVAEVEAQQASAQRLLPAAIGGVVAALLCGAAWCAMVVVTNFEIGYAAVGVGIATGYCVVLGAGKKKGVALQWTAVACSILGLLLGKFFTIEHYVLTKVPGAEGRSYLDPKVLDVSLRIVPHMLSVYDALWAFIALRIAWRVPRPPRLVVTKNRVAA